MELTSLHWKVLEKLGEKPTNEHGFNPVVVDGYEDLDIDRALEFLHLRGLIIAVDTGGGLGTLGKWEASSLTVAGRAALAAGSRQGIV